MRALHQARLYAILDSTYVPDQKMPEVCEQLIRGGADIIQLRTKDRTQADCIRIMDTLVPLFRKSASALIINDHPEIAADYPNVGLHIGQDDMKPEQARAIIGSERILGFSTHTLAQAKAAIELHGVIDYFAIGPVYLTKTKKNSDPVVGLNLISQVSALKPPLPFFCIGGINRQRIPEVQQAGASAVVCVSDLLCAPDIAEATQQAKSLLTA